MTRHEELLGDYARDLRLAKTAVEKWWMNLQLQSERSPSPIPVRERWPDGPASHPKVLSVIRTYWLRCEALNQELLSEPAKASEPRDEEYELAVDPDEDGVTDAEDVEDEDEVYPHVFILEWLMTPEHDDLAAFLGPLSYWPVGLDDEDNYT